MEILEHLELSGRSPFAHWFERLEAQTAAKVTVALARIGQGNLSNAKGVGRGVQEYRINFGPGYRLYFGRDGAALVILLGGGTKQGQRRDIATAHARWQDYKTRKGEGR